MKKKWLLKTLAIVIIFLFIGISFEPVSAVDIKLSINDKENENDCGCKIVSDEQRIRFEKLLNRLEIQIKKLSLSFKENPRFIEKYEELSNKILTLDELNLELKSDSPIIICEFLDKIATLIGIRVFACGSLCIILSEYYNLTLLSDFFLFRLLYFAGLLDTICAIMYKLGCPPYHPFYIE